MNLHGHRQSLPHVELLYMGQNYNTSTKGDKLELKAIYHL